MDISTDSFLSLRKFAHAVNCVNEAEVYIVEYEGYTVNLYKHRNLILSGNSPKFYNNAYSILIADLYNYLKDGGMLEQEETQI